MICRPLLSPGPRDGADGRVHAGGIAARSEYSDAFHKSSTTALAGRKVESIYLKSQTEQAGHTQSLLYRDPSMSLVAKIDADLKAAMIARDAEKLSVLRMLKSAVKYAAIEKGGADSVPSDLEVLAVVRKEAKKREDSIASYTEARPDRSRRQGKGGTGFSEDLSARAVDARKDGGAGQRGHRRSGRDEQGADGFGDESGPGQSGWTGRRQDA